MIPRVQHRVRPIGGGPRPVGAALRALRRVLLHALLAAPYLALAAFRRGPGLPVYLRILRLAGRLLLSGSPTARLEALRMALQPMDSVRYFEFSFAWPAAAEVPTSGTVLDVSSPRCFPLTLLGARHDVTADLVNPDGRDAATTSTLVAAAGLGGRVTVRKARIEEIPASTGPYDLVTCISVLEHIPGDEQQAAVQRLWSLVKPGGRLVLTLPVAREAFDEYLDVDEYGLLGGDTDGWTFGQRFHDASTLAATVFDVISSPARMEVTGEMRPGLLLEDRALKMAGRGSPWREPYVMATEFSRFERIEDLPGWGVACMEFVKAAGA